jgi:hypothetical protein
MGLTNFPNGVSSYGVPIVGGYRLVAGSVFWVDSGDTNSADGGDSGTFDAPFATIDYAVGRCTANNGDIIYVKPGHAEVVSAAGGLALDVAGITVVGIGDGAAQPTVTLGTAATADVDIDAANVTVENLHFVAALADIAVCIDVNATDFTLRGCRFTEATDLNFKICVQDAAAAASDRMTLEYNYANCPDAANTHWVNLAGTGNGHIIRNNTLLGDWGTMAIGGAGIVTYASVNDNYIYNAGSGANSTINMGATATGMCMNNRGGSAAVQTSGNQVGDLAACENYYAVNSEELQGVLDPVAT